mmetsp:Transcript_6965/g.12782  ORF Transcript_6965/g.12782 Transcript_6965/m.12782 type:complete len:223 (-) Transcript_6965:136-804(-)|eukprot:CAMPEP_0197469940 /NCGR_PEP_ID=MMETSP1309-20131121/478_1 /TAXON_ID=464262 /ORGANISM="Genus nov. species nov., Strain RCC998" /LENGTH=222 /DNA_ID=CAMNT_0043006309 /DNA_START=304 /DNA_END=972 /DNA_ORIENTATION=+
MTFFFSREQGGQPQPANDKNFFRKRKNNANAAAAAVALAATTKKEKKENRLLAKDESVTWESVKWKDGSRYEGLVKDGKCHVRGVLRYSNGDRYEGEYKDNHMSGLGVYVWKNGGVYRGQWNKNNMHGCGVKLVPKASGGIVPMEGEWMEDGYVGDIMTCSKYLSRKKAMDADFAAASARALELGGRGKNGARRKNTMGSKNITNLLPNITKRIATLLHSNT